MELNRRALLASLAASGTLWPCYGRTQIAVKRVLVAYLGGSSKASSERYRSGFLQGLREFGYAEGRDYMLQDRYAEGDSLRLPVLARELVALKPDVIVTGSGSAVLAMKLATDTIPIVAINLNDPTGLGLVASEARPGGNVTGILIRVESMTGKLVEVARDLVPGIAKVGALFNRNVASNVIQNRDGEAAAATLGLTWMPIGVRSADEIGPAFEQFRRERIDVAIVMSDALFNTTSRRVAAFALASHLPTVFTVREFVDDGGLISYGVNQRESFRRAAYFVNRILKGEKPADLPVEFPTKLEMVVNNATAKALGLTIPETFLVRADEVIE